MRSTIQNMPLIRWAQALFVLNAAIWLTLLVDLVLLGLVLKARAAHTPAAHNR